MHHFWDKEKFEYSHSAELPPDRIPSNGTNQPVPNHDPNTQHVIWNLPLMKWQVLSKKEYTEFLIGTGFKTKSEFQKVDENGEIVPKTRTEQIEAGLISIDTIRQEKLLEISSKARAKIEGGFESNAKGQWYIYDSTLEDQFNIKTLADSGIDCPLRCTKKSTGIKDFYAHTSAQLNQLVNEFAQYKMSILQQSHNHKVAVLSITNALELEQYTVNYN